MHKRLLKACKNLPIVLVPLAGTLSFALTSTKLYAQEKQPIRYWSFDGSDFLADKSGKSINATRFKCKVSQVNTESGKGMDLGDQNCMVVTNALAGNVKDEFSIEFLFKGKRFEFMSFAQQNIIIRFSYDGFLFRTTQKDKTGKPVINDLLVRLNKSGIKSYDYYMDGEWHRFTFTASLRTGRKQIYVDGKTDNDFGKELPAGNEFVFGPNDGFRNTNMIDELGFYRKLISPAPGLSRSVESDNSNDQKSITRPQEEVAVKSVKDKGGNELDPMEFAPGYPDYNVQATEQLKHFPHPRINNSTTLLRNMSWADITYLHRELPGAGGKGFGKSDPEKAVAISALLAEKWNYYLDLPVLRAPADAAAKNYGNPKNLYGALTSYAAQHPEYPYSSILIQAQVKPSDLGMERRKAFAISQDLPDKYYLRDKNGTVVLANNKKMFSPLMPLDIIQKDGQLSAYYLQELVKFAKRPPALVNENGEIFGHIRREDLLKQDPQVWSDYQRSGMNESQYSAKFQYRMDSTYRATVLKEFDPTVVHFSFYNVSAINPDYWPDYRTRRNVNRWNNNTVFPTPDFYPRTPDNWSFGRGPNNGFGAISRGRVSEIAMGDKNFSPFVSAGWGEEERNIRPAQYLALLKSMVMLGAEFFYSGYFNITGKHGKWPNGVGPYDPRGYAYQLAMPVYAQAIRTWVPDFFEKGELLNPASPNDIKRQFRFHASSENELILVRKLGNKYLVYGSIQPNSNIKGNVRFAKNSTINIDGTQYTFEIRRQGSLYVLDKSGRNTVFYQLDRWHQYEHPWFWSKDIQQEAEVFGTSTGDVKRVTQNIDNNNFSDFSTVVELSGKASVSYPGTVAEGGDYSIGLRAASKGNGAAVLVVTMGNISKEVTVSAKRLETVELSLTGVQKGKGQVPVKIEIRSGEIVIDNLTIRKLR